MNESKLKGHAPAVSVVMTTYNGQEYVGEQLDSILGQTYGDFELIIADDASSDGTAEILKQYAAKDDRVRLLLNPQNLGLHGNLEKALRMARGDFIAISDQDDIWEPVKIEELVSLIGRSDGAFCNSLLIDKDGNSLGKTIMQVINAETPPLGADAAAALIRRNVVSGHALLFRRRLLDYVLPFSDELVFDQQIAFFAAYGKGIRYLDKCLVLHRIHGDNHTNSGLIAGAADSEDSSNGGPVEDVPGAARMLFLNAMEFIVSFSKDCEQLVGKRRFAAYKYIVERMNAYDDIFFDLKLFLILLYYRKELFHRWEKDAIKKCFKFSKGGRYYRMKSKRSSLRKRKVH